MNTETPVSAPEMEVLGYAVSTVQNSRHIHYKVTGKRGAEYAMVRTVSKPEYMFATRLLGLPHRATLKGFEWFTDKDGDLRPVR